MEGPRGSVVVIGLPRAPHSPLHFIISPRKNMDLTYLLVVVVVVVEVVVVK